MKIGVAFGIFKLHQKPSTYFGEFAKDAYQPV
jgi:hypothetical protein